jgi:hypothetical protein
MTKDVPELWWAAPPGLTALLKRSDLRRSVEAYWLAGLNWRWAAPDDWPPGWRLTGDFRHAEDGGFGFVTDLGSKRLFVVPRGWDEPEWALAELNLADGRWRDLGCVEPWSPTWIRPEQRTV